jgi:hypothetical protein
MDAGCADKDVQTSVGCSDTSSAISHIMTHGGEEG